MKAKELMIDDWVLIDRPDKYAGAKAQIKSLIFHKEDDGQYFSVFIHDELGIVRREVFNEDLRPIALTAEILEKNGFVKGSYVGGFYSHWCPFRIYIAEGVGFSVLFDDEIHFTCTYIHQLQHALRLCGIEKEIEL